ncbi:MAG TPA: Rid family hydrolase [Anaerolineae bacterium]|jgi:enamine deaminase RidA (YjgF/YER057c/UK114 family)|nr:Rid family hydrolase [Anaerolineae bacterium]
MSEDGSYAQSKRIPAGTDLSEVFPYARAVRIGHIIEIAGTGAYDEAGNLVGAGDVYEQAKCIYAIIERTLASAGAAMTDVAKVTVFTTDISRWEEIARAHRAHFREIPPAVTVVEVTALMSPEMLVEIEATAVVS